MDPQKIALLKEVKERFRALMAKDREGISIAFLKVNLGVNSPEDLRVLETFLEGLPLELRPGKLDPFMNYLHSSSSITPPEFSGWYSPDEIGKESSFTKKQILPQYQEDEVETLRDQVRPFPKK